MVMYNHQKNFLLARERAHAHRGKVDLCDNRCDNHCDNRCDSRCDHCDHHSEPSHHHESCHRPEPHHKWNALDPTMDHPMCGNTNADTDVTQDQSSQVNNLQSSIESIVIKDSCDVDVSSTDTQAALNIQVALQAAIALVISISIADSSTGDAITQDLYAKLKSSQVNKQHTYIENSRGVNVTTRDTDIAVNAQLLLQVLIALVVRLDIL